jgi:DNA-binding Lrp family transcriptional regulator
MAQSSRPGHRPGRLSIITAIVLIQAVTDRIPETAQAIADIDPVTEVYSCAGDVDLIAIVRVTTHEDLAELVPGRISKIPGVLDTDTHIAFRSYSRRDIEATFSLGIEDAN